MSGVNLDEPYSVAPQATAAPNRFGARSPSVVSKPLFCLWMPVSALWIASVLFFESRDGKMGQELLEVFSMALLPPLVPPVTLNVIACLLAECCRP